MAFQAIPQTDILLHSATWLISQMQKLLLDEWASLQAYNARKRYNRESRASRCLYTDHNPKQYWCQTALEG